MKLKYRNITVPYRRFDKKRNYSYYIYQDKEYTDLNKLFTDFLGSYLTYHFKTKDTIHAVHNLNDVIEHLLYHYEDFEIPKEYKSEYSTWEYKYLTTLQKRLIKDELVVESKPEEFPLSLSEVKDKKRYLFEKDIYYKYRNVKIPKKVFSEEYNHHYYVVGGEYFDSLNHALDMVFDLTLYYQSGGTKNPNNNSHVHTHSFDELIALIFSNSSKFKIHVFQRQYYSKQELEFLEKLSEKLKEMKFHSVEKNYDKTDYEEYFFYKDNKKYIRLLFHNIRIHFDELKHQKEVLKSHKI